MKAGNQPPRAKHLRAANRICSKLITWTDKYSEKQGEVDASDAGLSPGHWPAFITVGNNVFYLKQVNRDANDSVTSVDYVRHGANSTVCVFND